MSFRTKLLLAFLGVSIALVAGAMGLASQAAGDAARDKIENDFARAAEQTNQVVRDRLAAFDVVSETALSDVLFRSQIGNTNEKDDAAGLGGDNGLGDSGGPSPIVQAHEVFNSAELPLFQRYPVLVIVNADGTLLYSKAEMQRYGTPAKEVDVIARGLKEDKSIALWWGGDEKLRQLGLIPEGDDEMYLVMARRVATRDGTIGAVITGEAASAGLLSQLGALSGSDVALANGEHWVTRDKHRGDVFALLHGRSGSSQFGVDGEKLMGMTVPIAGVGSTYMVRSLSKEIRPFQERLTKRLGIVFLASALISAIAGVWFARRLSKPLRALDKAARQVRTGDLSVRVPVESKDEIGHLAQSFNEMTEGLAQRDQIKATFKRYLAPAVVEELINNPDKLQLGGVDKELSILFSDLVGFTSLSEGRPAHELVALLNEYFDEVGQAIVRRGGTLDKFAGDSVMCFFGAPLDLPDHRQRALLSALDHLQTVDEIQERWMKLGRPRIDCRIGVNSGPVVVGNIGSRDGQDYTVIGDAVNLASRLEGVNKEYGSRFIASEDSLKGNEAFFLTRELDWLRVKGKNVPVKVFEVLCEMSKATPLQREVVARFADGLALYRKKQFSEAKVVFNECLAKKPGDGPSETFVERCDFFLAEPPEADWDGVWKMKTK